MHWWEKIDIYLKLVNSTKVKFSANLLHSPMFQWSAVVENSNFINNSHLCDNHLSAPFNILFMRTQSSHSKESHQKPSSFYIRLCLFDSFPTIRQVQKSANFYWYVRYILFPNSKVGFAVFSHILRHAAAAATVAAEETKQYFMTRHAHLACIKNEPCARMKFSYFAVSAIWLWNFYLSPCVCLNVRTTDVIKRRA